MKRSLLTIALIAAVEMIYGQVTYYWVGGAGVSPANINTLTNWNTSLDGLGGTRTSTTANSDILVFDGTNTGGATPTTGLDSVNVNGSLTCAQIKFINGANIVFVRSTSSGGGTSTVTISGGAGEDFVIESGCSLLVSSATLNSGSIRFAMAAANSGRVSGSLSMITGQQARFDNTTGGTPGSFVFTSGSSFTTNITSASSSYAFGSNSQSSPYWVTFESGSHLYYEGGFSPNGSGALFSAVNMKPGSTWHHRATNPTSNAGNFFNRQNYGSVSVENNATLIALGSIYRIENLTIAGGSSFTTYTSGQTVVLGNLQVDGALTSDVSGTNELVLAGSAPQLVSGSGTINIASLLIADNANVTISRDLNIEKTATVYGHIDFGASKLTGNGSFSALGRFNTTSASVNMVAGNQFISGTAGALNTYRGQSITGAGIPSGTSIVSYSTTGDSIFLSAPITASGTGIPVTVASSGATLQNNNANGYDPASGSLLLTGNQTFNDNINYIIDGATNWPFGVSTGNSAMPITAEYIEVNAPVTVNRAFTVTDHLSVNGKITLRPLDVLHISGVINGGFGTTSYIVTASNAGTGEQSFVNVEGIAGPTTIPIGTVANYLPVTITPLSSSDFGVTVYEGITANGLVNGPALTVNQKLRLVDAVWNITRASGSGDASVQLGWTSALEGTTFSTLPSGDIGLIEFNGTSWNTPIGSGDNSINTATATVTNFGSFGIGAVPPSVPFTFNPIPDRTYGDVDFNAGASSLNTTEPVVYTSSNTAVATIVAGNVHIVGAGTTTITATQASDGFYPAANVGQDLVVNKAPLTIKANDLLKFENQPNPTLTLTFTGFVLGETSAVLLTQPTVTTTATTSSGAGTYPISVSGATAANYIITFEDGVLTVQPQTPQTITFNALPSKTYGNADFAAGATSTNNTIPITYTSSNTAVATVNAGGIIHITGGGTTTITASQAGNAGYFPAANVARTLTVNKVNLTIRVLDTTKIEGQVNPPFTITYTGFIPGETAASLGTPPTVATIATTSSPAGYYTLTPGGAVTNNYNITYVAGRLTIYPPNGNGENHIHAFMSSGTALTVRVYSTFPDLGYVTLYDLNGRPLIKKNVFMPQGFASADLNVSTIPSGIYVVTATGHGVNLKKTIAIIK